MSGIGTILRLLNQIKSIAIGSFDGLHLGHQTLAKQVEALVIIERNTGYLTPGYKRSEYTDRVCCFYHFDKIKSLTPEGFIEKIKMDFPQLEKIVVGYDFHFGKAKAGNAELLKVLFDGEVTIVEQVSVEGIPAHSRTIKEYLREGRVKMANLLLGRIYEIEGETVRGQGLGKKSFVPTVNLSVDHYQLPLEGVYATRTKLNGTWYDSVSFLGHRVTTDGGFAVETHVLDASIGEIHSRVALQFFDLVRANQRFESFEALKEQIEFDIERAKEVLHER